MKQFFQDVKNSFLLSAAVSIILGIVLIVYPVKTSLLICYIAGALLLFGGVVALIRRCLNGETRMSTPHASIRQSITYGGEPPELKHLSRARKRKKIYRFPK